MASLDMSPLLFSLLGLLLVGQPAQPLVDHNVGDQTLEPVLIVDTNRVVGKVDKDLNFTVSLQNSGQIKTPIKIFWETTGPYISPKEEERNIFLNDENELNASISITSSLLGVYSIKFFRINERGAKIYFNSSSEITIEVDRESRKLNTAFNIILAVLVCIALFFMGMGIELDIIKKTLQRPIGPAVGLLCQFLLMPVMAYGLGYIFLHSNYERLGFLFIGCSPGGARSNLWTSMFGGDIDLSVTITFISTLFSFAMTTFWIYFLGTPLVQEHIEIPYVQVAVSLGSLFIPILLGIIFKRKQPQKAEIVNKYVSKPFFLLVLIIVPIFGVSVNQYIFYLMTWRHIVCGILLGMLGYAFGASMAALFGQGVPQIIAISMETAIQNASIGYLALTVALKSPYNDMACLPVLAFLLLTNGPMVFIFYAIYFIGTKLRERKEGWKEVHKEEPPHSTKEIGDLGDEEHV